MPYLRMCLIVFCCCISLICVSFSAQAAASSQQHAARKKAVSSTAQHARKSLGLNRACKLEAAASRRCAKRQSSRSASSLQK